MLKEEEDNAERMVHQDPRATPETPEQKDLRGLEVHKVPPVPEDHKVPKAHKVRQAQKAHQELLQERLVNKPKEDLRLRKKSRRQIFQNSTGPRRLLELGYPKEIIGSATVKRDDGVNL